MSTDKQEAPLKIVHLIAENVKKLRAVEISPQGEIVTISGRNNQGKTTVLDAIWMALDHTRVDAVMPIRKGESKARIVLDLGEIIVERKFNEKGSSLSVESAAGARFTKPQQMLDGLIGKLSFDPLAFARMDERGQFDELKRVVKLDVDINELDALNKGDFAKRTDHNRDAKQKRAQADGIIVAAGLPDAPLDEQALLDEMERATTTNTGIEQRRVRREQAVQGIADARAMVEAKRKEAAALRAQADEIDRAATEMAANADATQKKLDEAETLPALINVADIRVKHTHAKQVNEKLAQRDRRNALVKEAEGIEAQSAELTTKIEAREKAKHAAIAAAKMPVEGLGFGDGIITFDGVPFSQASTSVQIRVSLALAMAANPRLRVIRMQHGNDLDDEGLAIVTQMVKDNGYQLWLEKVDSSGKLGIVIEDGAVIAVDGEAPPPPRPKKDAARASA